MTEAIDGRSSLSQLFKRMLFGSLVAGGLSAAFAVSSAMGAETRTITVLWYSYAHPESTYRKMIEKLGTVVHTIPQSSGTKWRITFFGPRDARPEFSKYDVLVIQSGEGFGSGHPLLPTLNKVDFSGILRFKAAISAARGSRTVLTGADADVHAIGGETGHAPVKEGYRLTCEPPFTGPPCWDGAAGHLINAVNWAAGGRKLGIVSLVAAEFPGSDWWLHPDSFLRAELTAGSGLQSPIRILGAGTRENEPVIPEGALHHPLNAGLTSKGLGNWNNSFHAAFAQPLPGFVAIVNSTRYPGMAVAIASDKQSMSKLPATAGTRR